jgi:hypothetical protein
MVKTTHMDCHEYDDDKATSPAPSANLKGNDQEERMEETPIVIATMMLVPSDAFVRLGRPQEAGTYAERGRPEGSNGRGLSIRENDKDLTLPNGPNGFFPL